MIHIEQKTHKTPAGTTVIVLAPTGRLDITTAWQFRLKLQECISKLSRHVVVNLGQVNFIDSSGLTSLVAGMRDADKVKGSFRICSVHPEAKLVFEVTMMDSVFEILKQKKKLLIMMKFMKVTELNSTKVGLINFISEQTVQQNPYFNKFKLD